MGEGSVTQADRDEAAAWIAGSPYDVVKAEAEMIRIGQLDHHRLVQAFARHRQAAEKATREAIIALAHGEYVDAEATGDEMDAAYNRAINDVIYAIRSQGHE